MRLPALSALLVLLLGGAVASEAQSLSDLARREKERRARLKSPPAKVLSDDDLKPADEESGSEEAEEAPRPARASGGGAGEAGGEVSREPATWKEQARQARQAIADAEADVKAKQAHAESLRLDMDPTRGALDPSRLQRLEADRQQALADLELAQAALREARQAWEELQEKARRNSIPPGWLREQ